jgi:hypothetical protein
MTENPSTFVHQPADAARACHVGAPGGPPAPAGVREGVAVNRRKYGFLALAAIVVSPAAFCGLALYDVSRAYAFSRDLVERVAREGPAAEMPPDAPASRSLGEARRQMLEAAQRLGPVRQIEAWSCTNVQTTQSYLCDGEAFTCDFQGRFDKGAFFARVSTCRERTSSSWQLGEMLWVFPGTLPRPAERRI